MYLGVTHILEMRATADLFAAQAGWDSWPIVGGRRPLELALWLAFVEFFLGVFLFCGLLVRILSLAAVAVAGFEVVVLGRGAGVVPALLTVGSALLIVRGGGAGTMDATLGKMQRRSLKREAERQAARQSRTE
jgi:hypothetical protein